MLPAINVNSSHFYLLNLGTWCSNKWIVSFEFCFVSSFFPQWPNLRQINFLLDNYHVECPYFPIKDHYPRSLKCTDMNYFYLLNKREHDLINRYVIDCYFHSKCKSLNVHWYPKIFVFPNNVDFVTGFCL